MDQNWQMQACTLETVHVAVQHSTDNISEFCTKLSDDTDITGKVHAVIPDNGDIWENGPISANSLKPSGPLRRPLRKCQQSSM